jgi:gluconate 2-dehydrogenase gamma chain
MKAMMTIGLDRRDLLRRAIFLVGGVAALSSFGAGTALAAAAPFFSAPRMALLEQVAETIVPQTDTPGAIAASVPAFFDAMMSAWASPATQAQMTAVLDAVDAYALADCGASFVKLADGAKRTQCLTAFDAAAYAALDPPYRRFKELILLGYYLSEPGATQELRYEQIPGKWRSDVPLAEFGRSWAV